MFTAHNPSLLCSLSPSCLFSLSLPSSSFLHPNASFFIFLLFFSLTSFLQFFFIVIFCLNFSSSFLSFSSPLLVSGDRCLSSFLLCLLFSPSLLFLHSYYIFLLYIPSLLSSLTAIPFFLPSSLFPSLFYRFFINVMRPSFLPSACLSFRFIFLLFFSFTFPYNFHPNFLLHSLLPFFLPLSLSLFAKCDF